MEKYFRYLFNTGADPFMPLQLAPLLTTWGANSTEPVLWPGRVPNAVACGYISSPACASTTWGYSWPQQPPEGGEGEQMGVGRCLSFLDIFTIHSIPPQILTLVLIHSRDRLTKKLLTITCRCCVVCSLLWQLWLRSVFWDYTKRSEGFDLTQWGQEMRDFWKVHLSVCCLLHTQLAERWLQTNHCVTCHVASPEFAWHPLRSYYSCMFRIYNLYRPHCTAMLLYSVHRTPIVMNFSPYPHPMYKDILQKPLEANMWYLAIFIKLHLMWDWHIKSEPSCSSSGECAAFSCVCLQQLLGEILQQLNAALCLCSLFSTEQLVYNGVLELFHCKKAPSCAQIRSCESGVWTKAVKWPGTQVDNELKLVIKLRNAVGSCRFRW